MGEHDQAIAAGQRALALATAERGSRPSRRWRTIPRVAYHAQGDYRRAMDCLRADRGVARGRTAP